MYDSAWLRVFTIPASAPFLQVAIRALLDGSLVEGFPASRDPLALADATLYLPTRRACTLARNIFREETEAGAILPRIVALGDLDEDELVFAQAVSPDAIELSDELGDLERRLLLTQLVQKWAASEAIRREGAAPLVANTPASALALADALARLIDDMTTRQVPWDRLDTLVPGEHDEYWQLTLRFSARDRARAMARYPARARQNRASGAARPPDRCRGGAAQIIRRPGDRRRLHRFNAGDRRTDRDDRQAAARRGGAAWARHRP